MGRRLVFAVLPFAAAAVTMAVLAFASGSPRTYAATPVSPLTVAAKASGWRAPGVPVSVAGFAGGSARVLLRGNGRVVATALAGRLGRYGLRFTPRVSGRYRLT